MEQIEKKIDCWLITFFIVKCISSAICNYGSNQILVFERINPFHFICNATMYIQKYVLKINKNIIVQTSSEWICIKSRRMIPLLVLNKSSCTYVCIENIPAKQGNALITVNNLHKRFHKENTTPLLLLQRNSCKWDFIAFLQYTSSTAIIAFSSV